MAEKIPESNVPRPKSRAIEKRKSISRVPSTPDDKTEESGETGYSSAPHTSDAYSGADATSESAVWTSEDHALEDVQKQSQSAKKMQRKVKSSHKHVEGSESDSKLEKGLVRSPEKAPKTRSHKVSTPPKQTKASGDHVTTPPKGEGGTTPPKIGKSPKRSLFEKFKSPLKKTESTESTSGTSSSHSGTESCTKTEKSRTSAKQEVAGSTHSPPKRKGLLKIGKKSPVKQQSTSALSGSYDIVAGRPKHEKPEEKSSGTKPKVASVKTKSKKQEKKEVIQSMQISTVREPQSGIKKSIATTCERVSSGIQSIQLSKRRNDSVLLLSSEESMDTIASDDGKERISGTEEEASNEKSGESATELRRKAWRPKNPHQKGGFQEDVVWACFSSSAEDTGTEISTVSDSSAIQGGSESKKGKSSSSDSLSDICGLKEEGTTGGEQIPEKSHLQRQKRLMGENSSDSDEDSKEYGEICGSPIKKLASQKKSTEDSSEE